MGTYTWSFLLASFLSRLSPLDPMMSDSSSMLLLAVPPEIVGLYLADIEEGVVRACTIVALSQTCRTLRCFVLDHESVWQNACRMLQVGLPLNSSRHEGWSYRRLYYAIWKAHALSGEDFGPTVQTFFQGSLRYWAWPPVQRIPVRFIPITPSSPSVTRPFPNNLLLETWLHMLYEEPSCPTVLDEDVVCGASWIVNPPVSRVSTEAHDFSLMLMQA